MVLVAVVVLAAVVFINGGGARFPQGGGQGGSGVAHVRPVPGPHHKPHGGRHQGTLTAAPGGRQVAAHPAATGLATSLGPSPTGPPGRSEPRLPTQQQYGTSLQQLKAALGPG